MDSVIPDLRHIQPNLETCDQRRIIDEAIAEITRLRAGQFRWIPVTETLPDFAAMGNYTQILVADVNSGNVVCRTGPFIHPKHERATHWAPIPPLPEKSQEDKDEELWKSYSGRIDFFGGEARAGFLAGLKAARGEKP